MGWENIELLCISTSGILILCIGNIFIDCKRQMCPGARFVQEGLRLPCISACLLPREPSAAPALPGPVPHGPLSQPLGFPHNRVLSLYRTRFVLLFSQRWVARWAEAVVLPAARGPSGRSCPWRGAWQQVSQGD